MLVLSLKPGEKIVLREGGSPDHAETTISLAAIRGGSVRLAFDAPIKVRILREKLARQPKKGT